MSNATLIEPTYEYITKPAELKLVAADLIEYKKYFPSSKMLLGLDKETHFTDPEYREMMEVYRKEDKCIPPFVPTRDGGWEAFPRIMALGLDPHHVNRQYLIDLKEVGFQPVTEILGHTLTHESILIGHNFKYDLAPLMHMLKIIPEDIRCTMLMAQTRHAGDKVLQDGSEASFSLAALYERYIPEELFIALTGMTPREYEKSKKAFQQSDWSIPILADGQLQYSADDVRLIFHMYHPLRKDCTDFKKRYPQAGIIDMIKIECAAALEYADMEVRGVGADRDYIKNELIPYLETKADQARESLSGYDCPEMWVEKSKVKGGKTNPHTITWMEPLADSCPSLQTPQLVKCLQKLGFKFTKKTPKGDSFSTDKRVLYDLLWTSEPGRARSILERLLQVKKAAGNLSRYGYKMLDMIHSDGRYHASIFQLGSLDDAIETGRNSIKDPPLQTLPANDPMWNEDLEEIPFFTVFGDWISAQKVALAAEGKDPKVLADAFTIFRRMIVAREGYTLINADFSNQEVRAIGDLSCDIEIIRAFKNKEDLHKKTADNLGVERSTGKLFFLSTQYGSGVNKVRQELYFRSGGKVLLENSDVKILKEKHFKLYSGLAAKIEECKELVEAQLAPYNSLLEFRHRKPMVVGFTPKYKKHRLWCLTVELERMAARLAKDTEEARRNGTEPPIDYLHRYHKVKQEDGKYSTWGNLFNKRKGEIIREYFNFLIQADCAVVLKVALIAIGKEFRRLGFDMLREGVVLVIHDEILAEVKNEHVEVAKQVIEKCMLSAMQTILTQIPPEVALGFGTNWMEASP